MSRKRSAALHVGFGSVADVTRLNRDVRFVPEADVPGYRVNSLGSPKTARGCPRNRFTSWHRGGQTTQIDAAAHRVEPIGQAAIPIPLPIYLPSEAQL